MIKFPPTFGTSPIITCQRHIFSIIPSFEIYASLSVQPRIFSYREYVDLDVELHFTKIINTEIEEVLWFRFYIQKDNQGGSVNVYSDILEFKTKELFENFNYHLQNVNINYQGEQYIIVDVYKGASYRDMELLTTAKAKIIVMAKRDINIAKDIYPQIIIPEEGESVDINIQLNGEGISFGGGEFRHNILCRYIR